MSSLVTDAAAATLKDCHVAFLVEGADVNSEEAPHSVVLHGEELDFIASVSDQKSFNNSTKSNEKALTCSFFCSNRKCNSEEVCQNLKIVFACLYDF